MVSQRGLVHTILTIGRTAFGLVVAWLLYAKQAMVLQKYYTMLLQPATLQHLHALLSKSS